MDDIGWCSGRILLLVLAQSGVSLVQCRPVSLDEDHQGLFEDSDLRFTHSVLLGILVTVATLISLMIVLVLCACAEEPDGKNQEECVTDDQAVEVGDNEVPDSPSPDAITAPVSDAITILPLNDAPKQRTTSVQSNVSNSSPQDDALVRCSTIDRRLPELPPTPMPPVTPTNEEEEDDYNRTYDVIGDTKATVKVPAKEDKNTKDAVDDETDEQYASVSDNAANKQSRLPKTDLTADAEYNSIGDKADAEEGDEPYASVVVGDTKEAASASYASVAKDDKEGYSRLRSIQKPKAKEDTSEGGDKNGYARLRDITLENSVEGGAVGGAVGGAKDDDEEVPPVPYKPPDLQNEEEEEQDSLVQRTPSVGTAGVAAGVSVNANSDGSAAALPRKREPPYTQVSARESLEVVRARQQAEQSARVAAHYQTIEDDQSLDADHDGIYEPVDDQQLDNQLVLSPPPLPGERQGTVNGPSASNNWQMVRAPRVYEEITDETRPKPPKAVGGAAANPQAEDDDDIEPYAVTEKRPIPAKVLAYTVDKNSKANYAKVNKVGNKRPDQINNNARTEVRSPDSSPPPVDTNGLPLYAVVEKKGKGRESKIILKEDLEPAWETKPAEDNYQTVEDNYQSMEDNYQSVGDTTPNGEASASALAGGMIHVTERVPREDLWTKREHMYIDMETNQPSSPTETSPSPADRRANHSYEAVEVEFPKPASKKEKQKQAKKAKKEAKKERKWSKSGKKEKGGTPKSPAEGDPGVWQRQNSQEGNGDSNGNSNNNTADLCDDYENIVFPLQETRL